MLNKLKPYILHLRPRTIPITSFHMIAGLVIGYLINTNIELNILKIIIGIFVWVILLNGGTLAINSYYDNDKGDIGWLDNPPKVPKYLHIYSIVLMITGLIIAYFINYRFLFAYSFFFILSILYSVPPFRLKEKAGFDAFVNTIGYGVLTMYAGYAFLNISLSTPIILVILIATIIVSAV